VDFAVIELKQMSTGLARMSTMLSGAIARSHRVARRTLIPPTWCANCQMVRFRQPTGILIPVV
jgi:hypothetical protein